MNESYLEMRGWCSNDGWISGSWWDFFLDVFTTIKEFSRRSLAEIFFLDYCKSLVVQLHGRVWQLVLER